MKKYLIFILALFTIYIGMEQVHADNVILMTSTNTQNFKDFRPSEGQTKEQGKTFCLKSSAGSHDYSYSPSSGTQFSTLAWCVYHKYIYAATFYGPYDLNSTHWGKWQCSSSQCKYSVTLNSTTETYEGKILSAKSNEEVVIQGLKTQKTGPGVKSGNFNSPFLYFLNAPTNLLGEIGISTHKNEYKADPVFNTKNGWKFVFNDLGKIQIGQKIYEHLFYETIFSHVYLTRYGKNFESKAGLITFLRESDFFDKLGFTAEEKNNSLLYILPKIQESQNYYLTLLDDESIRKLRKYDFSFAPQEIISRYFVIYPTVAPVKLAGDLKYPDLSQDDKDTFKVKDYGEIYMDNFILPIWK